MGVMWVGGTEQDPIICLARHNFTSASPVSVAISSTQPVQAQTDEMKSVLGDLQAQVLELTEARSAAEAQAKELRAAADQLRSSLGAATAQVGPCAGGQWGLAMHCAICLQHPAACHNRLIQLPQPISPPYNLHTQCS